LWLFEKVTFAYVAEHKQIGAWRLADVLGNKDSQSRYFTTPSQGLPNSKKKKKMTSAVFAQSFWSI